MEHGSTAKAGVIVVFCGLVMVLASACDLSYTCDTVEPGSAGAGYPTESVGAGDYPSNGGDDEPEDEEVGSAQLEMAGSCLPSKTCTDMYVDCQSKPWPCSRFVDEGITLCAVCQENCLKDHDYKFRQCYSCGFY
ncbi:hypothetical protein [Sorangium sp. So ce1182]|uniref:hypothetical protein n=1 Tax=Sorangium sp. So ce1182 TaxID=3133334 RepID=UPI003F63D174